MIRIRCFRCSRTHGFAGMLLLLMATCLPSCGLEHPVSALPVAPPVPSLRFSGVLGQSQTPDEIPLENAGFDGAFMDRKGTLWGATGREMIRFAFHDGRWAMSEQVTLSVGPRGHLGIYWDGEKAFYIAGDWSLRSFKPEGLEQTRIADLSKWADVIAGFAVAPMRCKSGFAEKGKFFLLLKTGSVLSFGEQGTANGEILHLSPLDKDCPYKHLCLENTDGGMLVASYWPDNKVYRFRPDGSMVTGPDWPVKAFAVKLISVSTQEWIITNEEAWPILEKKPNHIKIDWTYYSNGLARAPNGSIWVSSTQGLIQFPPDSFTGPTRIGGIPAVTALATASDGTLLAAIGEGRILRLHIDDEPNSPLSCNGNEPFRTAGGWNARCSFMQWDGTVFLVMDKVEGQLWSYDPWQMLYTQVPWKSLSKPGAFNKVTAMALAGTRLVIVDTNGLSVLDTRNPSQVRCFQECASALKVAGSIAISQDGLAVCATPDGLAGFKLDLETLSPPVHLWSTQMGFHDTPHLAMTEGGLVVVSLPGSSEIAAINPRDGKIVCKATAASIPGGMKLESVCTRGPWVFAYDAANSRIIRLKLEGVQ